MDNLKDRVTIYQVAQAAGVSLATVSRVINKRGNVTEETRKRVEATIAKLGYKPSGLAQALATNKSTNIGIIIPSANYVYLSNLLSGISDVAKKKGFVLTLFTTSHSREEALSMIERVITSHVDGVIIFDDELNESDIAEINSYSVPTIVINQNLEGKSIGSIVLNYPDALENILRRYLEEDGSKKMVFTHVLDGGRLLATCEKRFVDLHRKLDKPFSIINTDDSYAQTYADALNYFRTNRGGEYFVAYRDSIAAAISNAALDSGLRIPEDIEVLSIVETKYAHIVRPHLSAINIDMIGVGTRAMYMLADLLNANLEKKSYAFEGVYNHRESTLG